MLRVMLLAPWILYVVAMATQRVTDNTRLSLVTFPMGAALLLPNQTYLEHTYINEALNCSEIKHHVLAKVGWLFFGAVIYLSGHIYIYVYKYIELSSHQTD